MTNTIDQDLIDDERVEFEEWYSANYLQHYSLEFKKDSFAKDINDKYRWLELQGAFESFKYGASLYTKPQPTSQDLRDAAQTVTVFINNLRGALAVYDKKGE